MRTVAVIPARGGSKGIPKKNLINFCGKPLLAWTILATGKAIGLDGVFVSTDDPDVAACAKQYGADVIQRPVELANDTATSESALIHAVNAIEKISNTAPERVVFLQPTSPLRESIELTNALMQFDTDGLDSLFCGAIGDDFLFWQRKDNNLTSFNYDHNTRQRRQDRIEGGELILETGSFYITKVSLLKETKNRLGGKIGTYLVPFWKGHEVDTLESLKLCESLMLRFGLDRLLMEDKCQKKELSTGMGS